MIEEAYLKTQTPIRVLVVDDHAIVRKGTCALLAEIDDIEVVGEAGNGLEAGGTGRDITARCGFDGPGNAQYGWD